MSDADRIVNYAAFLFYCVPLDARMRIWENFPKGYAFAEQVSLSVSGVEQSMSGGLVASAVRTWGSALSRRRARRWEAAPRHQRTIEDG